jgi:hypothetical protein
MPDDLDAYYLDVVLPCRGFNLWNYMSMERVRNWDFDKIRTELAQIEEIVKARKGQPS